MTQNFLKKTIEDYYDLSLKIISLLNSSGAKKDVIKEILQEIKSFTGFDAAAIRLFQENDYTYYCSVGFSHKFLQKEQKLCHKGNSEPVCMCGNVIKSNIDKNYSFFTDGGSFWTPSVSDLPFEKLEEVSPVPLRYECMKNGYQTIVLIPISSSGENIGLLQLNHKKENAITLKDVRNLEKIAKSIGIVFKRKKLEKEIVKKEKEIKKDKLKEKFFANLSHELKTPLNLIFSAVQLLERKKTKSKKYSNIIRQNANRLLRMVNNLLDITRINADYFQLNMVNCDLVKLVGDITDSVREHVDLNKKILKFKTEVESKYIYCDPLRIERIILNLLSNAIKFTDKGDKIIVSIKNNDKNNIFISVKDTGIGMSKDKQKMVFKEFRQVEDKTSRNQEGAGLGLPIVKSLVDMHGGEIFLDSEIGK
ncbi:MAG: GAF domain-containing sensor histidine kinase [Halanaerobiales bacterium]